MLLIRIEGVRDPEARTKEGGKAEGRATAATARAGGGGGGAGGASRGAPAGLRPRPQSPHATSSPPKIELLLKREKHFSRLVFFLMTY